MFVRRLYPSCRSDTPATATGYKNLVGARRASWRILQSVEQSEVAKGNEKRVKLIQKYRAVVEKELDEICGEILELLDKHLIPSASTCEASVFYLKMKADYLRYLSEFKVDADRKEAADKTLMAYNAAQDKALAELPSTNPIRLGLALNFSVFYYEVMNQPEKACNLAKQVGGGEVSMPYDLQDELLQGNTVAWVRTQLVSLARSSRSAFSNINLHGFVVDEGKHLQ